MTPLFYTSAQIAQKTGLPEETVRRIVREESATFTPDEMRFIPGGRVNGKVLRIYAQIFDLVTSGHAVTRTFADVPQKSKMGRPDTGESFIRRREGT
jgi:predicted transcriptional regulator